MTTTQYRKRALRGARWLPVLLVLGLLVVGVETVLAASPRQSAEEGEQIFQQKCAACHTVGKGVLVGPDLQGVTERRDLDWLQRWIAGPDKMLAAGDPTATELLKEYNNIPMPNLGLSQGEVASLIAYLEAGGVVEGGQPDQGTAQTKEVQAGALPEGDPLVGKSLFTGALRFQNGGPPCLACHSISGIGALGGGALGPDLTATVWKGPALASFLEQVTSPEMAKTYPTMNVVWGNKSPFTAEEKANLGAFLQEASLQARPTQVVWQLAGLAVAGVVVVLVIAGILWRRRLRGVRRPMVAGDREKALRLGRMD